MRREWKYAELRKKAQSESHRVHATATLSSPSPSSSLTQAEEILITNQQRTRDAIITSSHTVSHYSGLGGKRPFTQSHSEIGKRSKAKSELLTDWRKDIEWESEKENRGGEYEGYETVGPSVNGTEKVQAKGGLIM